MFRSCSLRATRPAWDRQFSPFWQPALSSRSRKPSRRFVQRSQRSILTHAALPFATNFFSTIARFTSPLELKTHRLSQLAAYSPCCSGLGQVIHPEHSATENRRLSIPTRAPSPPPR